MKKIIVLLLSALLLIGVVTATATTLGGWTVAEDNAITEERKAVFEKAMEEMLGVQYEPVTYLASQVVAGSNHCFLCKATVIVPDAQPSYVLVYLYEDLEGNVEIKNIADLDLAALAVPVVAETEAVAEEAE
ncbi:MAG: hypothetical protein Q4A66_00560 [Eubacteriales bacterium]|nr:hypothetical protein [Eubacteriales bacterium]